MIACFQNIWHQDGTTNEEVAELVLACLEPPMKRITSEGLASKLKVSSQYERL